MIASGKPSEPAEGLAIRELSAGYGKKTVLNNVSFHVDPGAIVALLGINGAGKTTCLKTVAGVLPPQGGAIRLDATDVIGRTAAENARSGIVLVPEGARSFHDMSVRENLEISGFIVRNRAEFRSRCEEVLECFPRLRERLGQKAGTLSGGERQMLAIGRALILRPRILLLDEPFLGLAPIMISEVVKQLQRLRDRMRCGIVVAEQHVPMTLRMCDCAFVLRHQGLHEVTPGAEIGRDEREVMSMLIGN